MKEKLIKSANEKGFSNEVNGGEGIFYAGDILENKKSYYLWLCLLQKWLRENYNIDLYLNCIGSSKYFYGIYENNKVDNHYVQENECDYIEALEQGLFESLKLIKL